MNATKKAAVQFAGTGALALLLTTSAFAAGAPRNDYRGNDHQQAPVTRNWQNDRPQNRSTQQRNEGRVSLNGRISAYTHENGGYRVRIDNDRRSFWIPEARLSNRGRDLRVGVSIGLGGVFQGEVMNVDAVNWGSYGSQGYYQAADQIVQGTVDRVNYRSGLLTLRDSGSGRIVTVDTRQTSANNLRPGDFVTLSGNWINGGNFAAYRIDR